MAVQPSIEISGLIIQEPITTLTDILVSMVCFYAFYQLKRLNKKEKTFKFFIYFFLTMGLATFFGGIIGHAFMYAFDFKWKLVGWLLSMFSVALIERGAIFHAKPIIKKRVGTIFAWINIIELITFLIITIATLNFFFVEMHATYGLMVVVFSIELYIYIKTKNFGSQYILSGVGAAALSAIVHLSKFSIHTWFNYLDISHVLMALSAYLFYKGVTKMIRINNHGLKN